MRRFLLPTFLISGLCGSAYAAEPSAAFEVGRQRFQQNCVNCHGPEGMGLASYPRVGGKDAAYITGRLETYRAGTRIGPNSALMIMMAKPLTDEDIKNLAAYLSSVQP